MPIPGPQDIRKDIELLQRSSARIEAYYESVERGETHRTAYGERMLMYEAEYLRAVADGIVANIGARYEWHKYHCEPAPQKR